MALLATLLCVIAWPSASVVASTVPAAPEATVEAAPAPALSWSAPQPVDPQRGYPVAISCPDAGFCMAVDVNGYAFEERDGHWSAPALLSPKAESPFSVSCTSARFCMATDINDHAFVWDGRSWAELAGFVPRAVVQMPTDLDVSCTSAEFCMAGAGTADWDGKAWSAGPKRYLSTAFSCTSASFCAAVGGYNMSTWDGKRWAAPVRWCAGWCA